MLYVYSYCCCCIVALPRALLRVVIRYWFINLLNSFTVPTKKWKENNKNPPTSLEHGLHLKYELFQICSLTLFPRVARSPPRPCQQTGCVFPSSSEWGGASKRSIRSIKSRIPKKFLLHLTPKIGLRDVWNYFFFGPLSTFAFSKHITWALEHSAT